MGVLAAVAAVLTVTLLVFQNASAFVEARKAVCAQFGWFCTKQAGDVRGEAVKQSPVGFLPAYCQNIRPMLRQAIAEFGPGVGRARIRICRRGGGCEPGQIKLGDDVQFEIDSDVIGRAVVIDLDEAGNETRLIPDLRFATHRDARVGPGVTLRIPEGEGGSTRASEAERGCMLVFVAPENGAAARAIVSEVAPSRGFENVAADAVVAEARSAGALDAQMTGWAFGWTAYEVTP